LKKRKKQLRQEKNSNKLTMIFLELDKNLLLRSKRKLKELKSTPRKEMPSNI
jgi:hypothetical protein